MPIHVRRAGALARVTLDAPGKRNALSVAMWRDLRAAFAGFDDGVRCVLLRGAGGHFAAGADIEEFPRERFDEASGRNYHLQLIAPALAAIRACAAPVVAAIEGNCVGGGLEIASCCDLRIAADNALLGAPVGKLGFPLALPELAPLLQLVGPGVAAELLLAGRLLPAPQAQAKGIVQQVVPAAAFDAEVDALVAAVLAGSPLAARLNKANIALLAAQGGRYSDAQLDASFAFFRSADYAEGYAAFLAKRPPRFTGT
jgi:enoyl-CoA hydratase/carnithine racemase